MDGSVLNPGWTAFEWRLNVQETDVTELVRTGGSVQRLEVLLGNGWWRAALGFDRLCNDYGDELGFIGALEIAFMDGSPQVVPTSVDAWHAFETPVRENSLYNGETIDARVEPGALPLPVSARELDRATLVLQRMPPVRRHATLRPRRVWTSPSGKTLVDFGQNLVGWVRARIRGAAGETVVLRHAEVIENGELGTRPLNEAKATDTFICSGEEALDVFEPTLTFLCQYVRDAAQLDQGK